MACRPPSAVVIRVRPVGRSARSAPAIGATNMRKFAIIAATSLAALAAGCTTMGVGTGQSTTDNVTATFDWTETGGTRGTMIANLSSGQTFQGSFFQVTQESSVNDYGPLWTG